MSWIGEECSLRAIITGLKRLEYRGEAMKSPVSLYANNFYKTKLRMAVAGGSRRKLPGWMEMESAVVGSASSK